MMNIIFHAKAWYFIDTLEKVCADLTGHYIYNPDH